MYKRQEVKLSQVKLQGNCKIQKFTERGVVVEQEGTPAELTCDDVIIALGLKSENRLADQLKEWDVPGIYVIGDARKVKNIRPVSYTHLDVYKRQVPERFF